MPVFEFEGKAVEIPAIEITPGAASIDATAWQSSYMTVKLVANISALRVHTNGKEFPGRPASNAEGAWFLIGDVILTSSQLASTRALPVDDPARMVAFTHSSEATVLAGTVLNIGIASRKFWGSGGGFQAEYVSGPQIQFKLLEHKHWHGRAGTA